MRGIFRFPQETGFCDAFEFKETGFCDAFEFKEWLFRATAITQGLCQPGHVGTVSSQHKEGQRKQRARRVPEWTNETSRSSVVAGLGTEVSRFSRGID